MRTSIFSRLMGILCVLALGGLARMAAAQVPVGSEVGMRGPEISLSDAYGKTVRLSSYAGRPVVLVFNRGYF